MAAMARRRPGGGADAAEEDIAAIAKQISDTAEVIYQNWKSRNLAPADLIACHAAGDTDKLGSMLKPQPPVKPSIDLLAQAPNMDNNRLEKLVKNFVHEDKARLAAQAASKPMPSSIQYALQKFEKNAALGVVENGFGGGTKNAPTTAGNPGKKLNNYRQITIEQTYPSPLNKLTHTATPAPKPQISPKPPHLSDTIEMTLPPDLNPAGLQTWPLKNRVIGTDKVSGKKSVTGNSVPTPYGGHSNGIAPSNGSPTLGRFGSGYLQSRENSNAQGYSTLPSRVSKTTIDEVALEEKRLINALKNGEVVNEEPVIEVPSRHIIREPEKSPEGITKWGLRSAPKRPEQQVPHPELTSTQRLHLRQSSANPVRPFLTRGSVAERVLIFERCPSDLLLDKRVRTHPASQASKPQPSIKPLSLQHTTLQRHVRAHRNVNIPRFHYPAGKPVPPGQVEAIRAKVKAAFAQIGERASREHFGAIAEACQLPLYWKTALYLAACADKGTCTLEQFMTFWQGMSATSHDAAARFVYILTRGRRQYLVPEDFIPLVQDVVETHPGLTFLKEATEFHSRYVHTVIARIYYCVNRSWSAKISVSELRRSNLLTVIQLLEEEEDINQITQFFSYEHFYVIYCKFWELDRDHDLFIDKQDLTRHNDHALSSRIIERIFCGCVTRGNKRRQEDSMSYTDFVWFLLSEEDKSHPTAIEYWFRCMDLDGDGYLSMYELEYFYEEQMQRMESIGIETLPFQDCLCQMLDMVKPKIPGKISLSDLKRCKMTPIFFDTFFNLEKYLDHEQRDPFASQRDHDLDGIEMSDWDRYASEEYELLVAEEGGNEGNDSMEYECGYDRLLR